MERRAPTEGIPVISRATRSRHSQQGVLGGVHLDCSLVGDMLSDSGECLGRYELEGEGTWDLLSERVGENASARRCRVIAGSGDDEHTARNVVLGVAFRSFSELRPRRSWKSEGVSG